VDGARADDDREPIIPAVENLVQAFAGAGDRLTGLAGVGMRPRELLRSDELANLADTQVVGLYIHLVFPGGSRATGEKKPPVPAVFSGCALFG